mgnify:FL=1
MRAFALEREFASTVSAELGKTVIAAVEVSTSLLTITAVDDDQNPIDRYIEVVEISGPLNFILDTPPKDLEMLEGTYTVTVTALGKSASQVIVLANSETKKYRS